MFEILEYLLLMIHKLYNFSHKITRKVKKRNPLKHPFVMGRLNPYDRVMRKASKMLEERRKKEKARALDAKRGIAVSPVNTHSKFLNGIYSLVIMIPFSHRIGNPKCS